MVTHTYTGFRLSVDRGPNWLFVKLRPKRHADADFTQVADELWSIASRHFIYRLVLELEELRQLQGDLVDQLVLLQERLVQCGGSLRICGLSADCARRLRDNELDVALPNYATRQAAVLGDEAVALREKLKEMLETSASEEELSAVADFARHAPCLQ